MKKNLAFYLLISQFLSTTLLLSGIATDKKSDISLSQLTATCFAQDELPHTFSQPAVAWSEFEYALEQAAQCINNQYQNNSWLGKKPEKIELNTSLKFKPFVQKISIPHNSKVLLFGDLHGSVHGLLRTLNQLKQQGVIDDHFKIANNTHMLFLGDYVDRGKHGVEVIYALLRLKQANPEHVFFARGNHEDINLNSTSFSHELEAKFSGKNYKKISRFYDLLPVAIYLGAGTKYIQCCHGGMEIGYNPQQLLASKDHQLQAITRYTRPKSIQKLPHQLQMAIHNCVPYEGHALDQEPTTFNTGFMWNDFIVDEGQTPVEYTPGRGWVYGKNLTQAVLDQTQSPGARVCGVFRAHQHWGPMLERLNKGGGKASLWDSLVHTFFSAPAIYGKRDEKAACWQAVPDNTSQGWKLEKVA